jgi:hypothetical protein
MNWRCSPGRAALKSGRSPEIRSPKLEGRKKAETRNPRIAWSDGLSLCGDGCGFGNSDFGLLSAFGLRVSALDWTEPSLEHPCRAPAPIHEGPLAQRRCFIPGCWLRGDSGSGASAPWAEGSGSGQSPAGWSSKRVRMGRPPGCPPGARPHPRPGVARVSPRYCYGIATVYPRCISHVDAINMGDTPGRYRGDTVAIPCRLAWG